MQRCKANQTDMERERQRERQRERPTESLRGRGEKYIPSCNQRFHFSQPHRKSHRNPHCGPDRCVLAPVIVQGYYYYFYYYYHYYYYYYYILLLLFLLLLPLLLLLLLVPLLSLTIMYY